MSEADWFLNYIRMIFDCIGSVVQPDCKLQAVVATFKALHKPALPVDTEVEHQKPESERTVSEMRFEGDISEYEARRLVNLLSCYLCILLLM
jgi:hypothetical protein